MGGNEVSLGMGRALILAYLMIKWSAKHLD